MKVTRTVPQFFTTDLERTFAYFVEQLGFERQFLYGDPASYGGVIRDGQSIFFRHFDKAPVATPEKYREELLDVYIIIEDIDSLFAEYQARNVEFHRTLATMPWGFREFVVRDCDGRLLCFGEFAEAGDQA